MTAREVIVVNEFHIIIEGMWKLHELLFADTAFVFFNAFFQNRVIGWIRGAGCRFPLIGRHFLDALLSDVVFSILTVEAQSVVQMSCKLLLNLFLDTLFTKM